MTDDTERRRRIKAEEETQGQYTPPPDLFDDASTPAYYRPALDKDNMPLPRRVDEVDFDGTRVTRAAYEPASR